MKKLGLLLLLLIFFTENYGQNSSNKESNVFQRYKYSIVDLSLDPNWLGGNIYLNDSTVISGYVYKYNIITDEIEVKANINPANVEYISIGGKIFLYSKFMKEDKSEDGGYFEVLVKGDCMLLLRRGIKEVTETTSDLALGKDKEKNTVEETFYIKKKNQHAVMVKNKKSLSEYLSDKEGFAEYLDKKVIVFLTQRKATEIIEHYNQL